MPVTLPITLQNEGRTLMRKKLSILVILSSILAVTACGATSEDGNASISPNNESEVNESEVEKEEIRFALWAGGKELEEFNAIVAEVNAESDEFEIIVESIPDNYTQKLSTQFAGGTAADLIWLSQDNIYAFAELGALYDITEFNAKTSNEELKKENFYENIIKTAEYEGGLYGLPWIANPVIVYFNKQVFEDAGVELPEADENGVLGAAGNWTWDDFVELAAQFPNGDDTHPGVGNGIVTANTYGWITGGWPPVEMYLWAEGGDILDENYQSIINTPESIAGLQLLKDILNSGITPDVSTVWDQGFSETWLAGNTAMIMAGAADDFELRELTGFDVEDIGYGLVPSGVDGKHHSFNWTASTVMNAETENPELAYKAMEALTLKFFEWKVTPPVKDGIDRIDTMLEGSKIAAKAAIEAALVDTRGGNYHTTYGEINTWGNLFEPILLDPSNFDVEGTAAELDSIINEILNR